MKKKILLLLSALLFMQPIAIVLGQENDPEVQCARGIELYLDDNPSEALPLIEAGFAGRDDATFSDPSALGFCALVLGLLRDGRSDWDDALQAYTFAQELFAHIGERQLEGLTLNNIAGIYDSQGRYEEALTRYEAALAIFQELSDLAGEGTTLNNIGFVYWSQGRYEMALTRYEEALAIRSEIGDRVGKGTTLNNIGVVYGSQGQYEEALTKYEEALDIIREIGDREGEGRTLINIAGVYDSQGRYDEALTRYETALAILREVGERAVQGTTLNNIGYVYHSQGRYEEALTQYDAALEILREVGDRASEGRTFINIAAVYDAQGLYDEALTSFQEALAIHREVGDRAGEGATLNNIGHVYDSQGRYEKALTRFEEALAIRREIGDREGEGTTLNNIGLVYQILGNYEEALTTLESALAITREVGDPEMEGKTLNNIGYIYRLQERQQDALTYYEQAIELFEQIRAVAGSDLARASFIAQYGFLYDRALDLFIMEAQWPKAFLVSEQGRARSFGDGLATGSVQLTDNEAAPLIAAEVSSYNKVIAAQDALARARALNPPDPELVTELEIQLEAAQVAHEKAQADIEAYGDQLADLVPGRQAVATLPVVQVLLDDQSTLVSFWVLEDHTIAFILTRDSFDVVSIDVSEEMLNTQIKAFHDFPDDTSAHPDTAITLYNALIPPLRPYLRSPHLIIIPHQALHYLPFAALTDGQRYLMDEFAITYLPNASMLQFLPDPTAIPTYDTALILANPATVELDEFGEPLQSLPLTEQSAKNIARLFGTTPLPPEEATETAVRQNVNSANILHLGAHGRYNTVAPMQSAIYLAPEEDETEVGGDNGRLRVQEVYGLPMDNIELVVLSACETNLGYLDRARPLANVSAGDEVVSLNRAFLFQAPTVISSLWTVDEAATSLLMEQFYTYLLDGKSKADALRLAQLDVRSQYPNPYNWAGFVLSGDGGEIDESLLQKIRQPKVEPETTGVIEATQQLETTPEPTPTPNNRICPALTLPLALVIFAALRKKRWKDPE